jgi:hypothetical protein
MATTNADNTITTSRTTTNVSEMKVTLNNLNRVYEMHTSNRITLKEIVFYHLEREIEMLEKKIAFYSNN